VNASTRSETDNQATNSGVEGVARNKERPRIDLNSASLLGPFLVFGAHLRGASDMIFK
jgi:hypothetical protein